MQAGLEPADEGWKQLRNQLDVLKPTVLIVGYGMADSFARRGRVASIHRQDEQAPRRGATGHAGAAKLRVLVVGPLAAT